MSDDDLKLLCFCFECSPPLLAEREYLGLPDRGIWRVHACVFHGPISIVEITAELNDPTEES